MRPTTAQLETFEREGFLVVPDFVPTDRLDQLRARASELEASFITDPNHVTVFSTGDQAHGDDTWFLESGDKVRGFFEANGGRLNKLGHAMHDLDPVFSAFCRELGFADVAQGLGIDEPKLVQSMYIFKHPGIGGEVTWHTDHTFLWTNPRSVVGLWVAVDDATIDNGCMWAIPGGHRIPVKSQFRREGMGTTTDVFDPTPYPIGDAVPLEVAAGTLIVLDGALPHWSDVNRSPAQRQAFTLHIVDGHAEWVAENWLQRPPALPFAGF